MASTLQTLLKNAADKEKAKLSGEHSAAQDDNDTGQTLAGEVLESSLNTNNQAIIAPTSPEKNFTEVPNSVTSEAIPQGLFKGLSKHTYDVLYKLTRGAINPVREVQLTRLELMKLTGLSENTQRAHIKYLSLAGLIKVSYQTGKHEGAIYETLVPEELVKINPSDPYQPLPSTPNQYQPVPSPTKPYQNLVPDTSQKLGLVSSTNRVANKGTYGSLKTLYKTKTNDDDKKNARFSDIIEKFDAVSRKMTGRGISQNDIEKWNDFADLIILELEIAAKHTNAISSVPAFLTEVFRRKLSSAREQQTFNKSSKSKVVNSMGKTGTVGSYEIKSLDENGRMEALEQLREFVDDDFLDSFKKWYTAEDWKWLIENLSASDKL